MKTDGSGNNGGTQPESFDSNETQESDANAGHAQQVLTCSMEMKALLKVAMKDMIPYDDFGYGYEEEHGGFGDY